MCDRRGTSYVSTIIRLGTNFGRKNPHGFCGDVCIPPEVHVVTKKIANGFEPLTVKG
jgi:hypothetical protein